MRAVDGNLRFSFRRPNAGLSGEEKIGKYPDVHEHGNSAYTL